MFFAVTALIVLGALVQMSLPAWDVDPQLFYAANVIIEVSRAALCLFIFGVRWMTREFRPDQRSMFISSAFLALGILTIARLMTSYGMPFGGTINEITNAPSGTGSSFNDSLYYDTVIRLSLAGLMLIGAFIPPSAKVKRSSLMLYPVGFVLYSLVAIIIVSVFDHSLPRQYIPGLGMTSLRDYIGFVSILGAFVTALVYARLAAKSAEGGYAVVSIGLLLFTEANFSFSLVADPIDLFLLAGRTMALIAWFLIFLGLVKPSLTTPYFHLENAKIELDSRAQNLQALARDVMERREAEEEILALNAELEASNKELESFCYSVSHDLRAPLRTIDGFSKFLIEEEGGKLSLQGQDHVARMRRACERMGLIIEDLLRLSRVVREEMSVKEFDIASLARAVADETRVFNPKRDVEFVTCGPEMVEGDERLMRIALENLLQNAWKFTSKKEHASVEFGVTRMDGERVFFVKDNGAGFDMKYYDKMFKPFERLHTESEFPGTGVGLASVQRVVVRHGGRVWAEGKVGEGAIFYFTLGEETPLTPDLSPRP